MRQTYICILLAYYCGHCFGSLSTPDAAFAEQRNAEAPTTAASLRGGSQQQRQLQAYTKCGCSACDFNVLNAIAEGFTCGSRIDYVMNVDHLSETDACLLVANEEYPDICGGCDPSSCAPAKCGCTSCNNDVLNSIADGFTCGSRINYVVNVLSMSETDACSLVADEEYPDICGDCDPASCQPDPTDPPTDAPSDPATTDPPTDAPSDPATTDSPTDAPTVPSTEPKGDCEDNPNPFFFKGRDTSCAEIASLGKQKKQRKCQEDRGIIDECPSVCDADCQAPIPTQPPTASRVPCVNNPGSFLFRGEPTTCAEIDAEGKQIKKRKCNAGPKLDIECPTICVDECKD